MTVYVDDMEAEFHPPHAPHLTYVMCHMIADTDAELHAMADAIGVERRWHQAPPRHTSHYDITKGKRKLAIRHGAVQITWRQAGAMMQLKKCGLPMGHPDAAVERWRSVRGEFKVTKEATNEHHQKDDGTDSGEAEGGARAGARRAGLGS